MSGDSATYSEVGAFLMKEHTAIVTYKSIVTSLNQTISLTGNHLIYGRKHSTENFFAM